MVFDEVHSAVSSANNPCSVCGGISFIESAVYRIYNNGDIGDPCGVPLIKLNGRDKMFSISIAALLLCKNEMR